MIDATHAGGGRPRQPCRCADDTSVDATSDLRFECRGGHQNDVMSSPLSPRRPARTRRDDVRALLATAACTRVGRGTGRFDRAGGDILRLVEALLVDGVAELAERSRSVPRDERLTLASAAAISTSSSSGSRDAPRPRRRSSRRRRRPSRSIGIRSAAKHVRLACLPCARRCSKATSASTASSRSRSAAGDARSGAPRPGAARGRDPAAQARGEGPDAAPPASADRAEASGTGVGGRPRPGRGEPAERDSAFRRGVTLGRTRRRHPDSRRAHARGRRAAAADLRQRRRAASRRCASTTPTGSTRRRDGCRDGAMLDDRSGRSDSTTRSRRRSRWRPPAKTCRPSAAPPRLWSSRSANRISTPSMAGRMPKGSTSPCRSRPPGT